MAGHRRRAGLTALLTVVVVATAAAPAAAFDIEAPGGPVSTRDDAVVVELVYRSGDRVVPASAQTGRRQGTTECAYWLYEIPSAAEAYEVLGEPPAVDAVPYWLMCGSARLRPMWITPAQVVDLDEVVRGEAQRYVETVLGPGLSIGVAPEEFAVTGAPASLWLDGWDGQRIAVPPISPFGETVEVFLDLESVTWDLGDGSSAAGDLRVRHTYTHRSTSRDEPDGAYRVSATVTVAVSYRVDGGAEVSVSPPLTTVAESPVIVRELQAVLG